MGTVVHKYQDAHWGKYGMYTHTVVCVLKISIGMGCNVHLSPPAKVAKFSTFNSNACARKDITGMDETAAIPHAWVDSCGRVQHVHVLLARTITAQCVFYA